MSLNSLVKLIADIISFSSCIPDDNISGNLVFATSWINEKFNRSALAILNATGFKVNISSNAFKSKGVQIGSIFFDRAYLNNSLSSFIVKLTFLRWSMVLSVLSSEFPSEDSI